MPPIVWLASLAVACSVLLALWALAGLGRVRAPSAARRLTRRNDLRELVLERRGSDRIVDPFLASLANRARQLTPSGMTSSIEDRIEMAGATTDWPIERVLAVKVLAGGLGGLMGVVLLVTGFSIPRVLVGLALAVLGWFIPDLLLLSKAQERSDRLEQELPDALDQMTVSVEAGLGFDAAMSRLAQEGGTEVANEFGRVIQDVQIGVPRQAAMERMLRRANCPSMRHFVTALGQADRLGVPLANALRVLADELREKRRVTAQERAMKMPVKLSFPLVLCVMPALFVVILGPAIVRMLDSGIL
ncbi:MAG TPA: type II secretion system F family protein [Microthrixaceae bacterium]|nr:type II secretion system F family protein [Microthrixaceae bacterium]